MSFPRDCLSCGHQSLPDALYCVACGVALNQACPLCRSSVMPNDQYCGSCGANLLTTDDTSLPRSAETGPNPFRSLKARSFVVWGLASVLIAIAFYLVAWVITGFSFNDQNPVLDLVIFSVWLYGLMVVWTASQFRHHGVNLRRLAGRVQTGYNWWPSLGVVALLLMFSAAALWLVYYPLSLVWPTAADWLLSQDPTSLASETGAPILFHSILIVELVVVAPILEELLFRGVLFTRWSVRWGMGRGMILSSLVFGVLHFDNVLGATVFGAVMALLYVRTGTLLVPMACHALYNGIVATVYGFSLSFEAEGPTPAVEGYGPETWVALVFFAVSGSLLLSLIRRWWKARSPKPPYFIVVPGNRMQASSRISRCL